MTWGGSADTIERLCAEVGIKLVDGRSYPDVGETRAIGTLQKILEEHGEDHLRLVLITLGETSNNRGSIDRYLLTATSTLVRRCYTFIEKNISLWLEIWDACPVGQLQFIAYDMGPPFRKADTIASLIYERIYRVTGPNSTQPDLFDERTTA
jgi:hypothetical protein